MRRRGGTWTFKEEDLLVEHWFPELNLALTRCFTTTMPAFASLSLSHFSHVIDTWPFIPTKLNGQEGSINLPNCECIDTGKE